MLGEMAKEALAIFRTPAVVVVLVIVAAIFVAFGGWILAMGRLPAWMKGWIAWPLRNLTPRSVVIPLGLAIVLIGLALAVSMLLVDYRTFGLHPWLELAVALVVAGAALLVRSVVVSRRAVAGGNGGPD